MAEAKPSDRSSWIQITLRVKLPPGVAPTSVFSFLQSQHRELHAHIAYDYDYRPVPVSVRNADPEFVTRGGQFVIVRARVNPDRLSSLRDAPFVDHVGRDSRVEPFEWQLPMMTVPSFGIRAASNRIECATTERADGTAAQVARDLGVERLWKAGLTGRGIVVGIVDGGITAYGRPMQFTSLEAIPHTPATGHVIAGWPADWGTTAEGWGQHGNMIAFDVQAIAPEAALWDIRIWQPDSVFETYVSNAIQGYRLAIESFLTYGVPHILVNAWGVYDSATSPEYAFDPKSDIAVLVEQAIDAGILLLFAAGNCGDGCSFAPGTPCGIGDRGPGGSILGPNGHPEVMSVGAATLKGDWCGYTSQGPAALPPNDPDKPDFCAISQFEGFFPNESGLRPYDGGTSAATGIAGGIVALLKQARSDLTQAECKRALRETAHPIRTAAAYDGAGAGIIDPVRALRAL
jgi:serine protease AprX